MTQGAPIPDRRTGALRRAQRAVIFGIAINAGLAAVKGAAGYFGSSFALVADAVESGADVLGSVAVLIGFAVAALPATRRHPYGKGKAEHLASLIVGAMMLAAAAGIAFESVRLISTPHESPRPWTLAVLALVIAVKEGLFRLVRDRGRDAGSAALQADAWHHRSDALTSGAAFIGIFAAWLGGPGWEKADDWAALLAAAVIGYSAFRIISSAASDISDASPDPAMEKAVRRIAEAVEGVLGTHRCWIRRSGLDYFVELDVVVDGGISVQAGHELAHQVNSEIRSEMPMIARVMVHVEPEEAYGRHAMPWEIAETGNRK